MSENFEKTVLEKLDKLEKNYDNLEKGQTEQQKFNKSVLEKLDKLEKSYNNLEKGQEKLEKGQEKQGEFNNYIMERFRNQDEFNMRILEVFENLKDEVSDINKELTKFSNHFTAFEFENNRKVDLLLENYDFDRKQLIKHDKDIFNLKKHSFNHEDRISSLELKTVMP